MQIVMVNPGEEAFVTDIDNTLGNLQHAVGGLIEAYYPFDDDVCIICNEEGKYNGMEPNRAIYQGGEMVDIIFGPFLISGLTEDDFGSLTDEQAEAYKDLFELPEMFTIHGGEVIVEKVQN